MRHRAADDPQGQHSAHQEMFQPLGVAGDDLELIVRGAGDGRAFHDLILGLHEAVEPRQRRLGVVQQRDLDISHRVQPRLLKGHQRHLALDHPALDQAAQAAPGRRGGQARCLGQGLSRDRAVLLQQAQDAAVRVVQLGHGVSCAGPSRARLAASWQEARQIEKDFPQDAVV